jgi:hypothetical protein
VQPKRWQDWVNCIDLVSRVFHGWQHGRSDCIDSWRGDHPFRRPCGIPAQGVGGGYQHRPWHLSARITVGVELRRPGAGDDQRRHYWATGDYVWDLGNASGHDTPEVVARAALVTG